MYDGRNQQKWEFRNDSKMILIEMCDSAREILKEKGGSLFHYLVLPDKM